MSYKSFSYCGGLSVIQIDAPEGLLRRISNNIEGEGSITGPADCRIKIDESENPIEIKKDKRFEYATIEKSGTEEYPIFRYYRYDTHIRTIRQGPFGSYEVNANTSMDENSALICVRNHLSNNPRIKDYPLLHASLVNINGTGTLVTGDSMHGKTTMAIYLLQKYGGTFVSEENTLLDPEGSRLRGLYIPRTVRVRFSTIAESKLSKSLDDLSLTDATQYLDSDFIQQTLKNRDFTSKWGLAFSRKAFCQLLGVTSDEFSTIENVIFPVYQEKRKVTPRNVGYEEGIERLSKSGLIKKVEIDPKELQDAEVNITVLKDKKLNFIEVAFSGIEDLIREGFEP